MASPKEIPAKRQKSSLPTKGEQRSIMRGEQNIEEQNAFTEAFRWDASFPYLVRPVPDEWLPGLLLRCDAINEWPYGTTLRLVYERAGIKVVFREINFCAPKQFPFIVLAEGLGLSITAVRATTYLEELARIFPQSRPHPAQLGPFKRRSYPVCPLCVQQGIFHRFWCLPGLTLCPNDGIVLRQHCSCQTAIQYPHGVSTDLTCSTCQLPWSALPAQHGLTRVLQQEQRLFAMYQNIFQRGTAALLGHMWRRVSQWMSERRILRLPLSNGTWLAYDFTHRSVDFSLYRLLAAVLSIQEIDPTWDADYGLPLLSPKA